MGLGFGEAAGEDRAAEEGEDLGDELGVMRDRGVEDLLSELARAFNFVFEGFLRPGGAADDGRGGRKVREEAEGGARAMQVDGGCLEVVVDGVGLFGAAGVVEGGEEYVAAEGDDRVDLGGYFDGHGVEGVGLSFFEPKEGG